MYKIILSCSFVLLVQLSFAQSKGTYLGIQKACMNYIEGFYEGDTAKLISCLRPSLYKIGFFQNAKTGIFESRGQMTYQEAIAFARQVKEKERFAKPDSPKKVEVLSVLDHIACAKVTAWWGYDYMLLSKAGNEWMIEQVLWQGPLEQQPKEQLIRHD